MKLKTVIIGGSNTVMAPGYWPTLLATMARRGVMLDVVADLAVGGTTSAFGLYQLKTHEHYLADCDLLIVEYAINDSFIYGEERRPVRHWARIYEGIIRFALERNPRLHIATLVFGARNGSFLNAVPSIDAGIRYICDWYETTAIDVSRLLMRRYGREVVGHAGFYSDQGHYARPVATGIVADLIAEALEPALRAGPRAAAALPAPIDPEHAAGARALDAAALAKRLGLPTAEYSNRRFALTAVDLGQRALRFELEKGRLLALAYVCEPRVAPLDLALPDATHRAALLKGGVRDGTFKFLASMLSFEFLYGTTLLQPPAPLDLVISAGTALEGERKHHVPRDNVAHEVLPEHPTVPILGLLFTGDLKRCAIEKPPERASAGIAATAALTVP